MSATGTYYGSWAPYNGNANTTPVNGVTFQGFSDLPGLNDTTGFYDGGAYYNMTTGDANYNSLLKSAGYGNGNPGSFSWNVTAGNSYLVQLWVNDGRNIGQTRWESFTGGLNTSANALYGSDGSGLGQYVIGTFVADGSSQSIGLTPGGIGGSSIQLNLFQVRDITPVPEPSSLALLAVGLGAAFCRSRRNSRGN